MREIQLVGEEASANIACPTQAVPAPGQYLLALDADSVLGLPLFFTGAIPQGFLAAPPIPSSWVPGTRLTLYGPLGCGFHLPQALRRLALIAAGEAVLRLLPLVHAALDQGAAVALFADHLLPSLPPSLEAYPLNALPDFAAWPDFIAVDAPAESLPHLLHLLEQPPAGRSLCAGQVFVQTAMPCAGIADCGVCAVKTRRSWKLACKNGPVFLLEELLVGW